MKVAEAFVEIEARFDKLRSGLNQAVGASRSASADIQSRFNRMTQALRTNFATIGATAKRAFAAVGVSATAAAAAVAFMFERQASSIDDQAKFARRIGVTVQELREFEHVAGLSGIAANQFRMALQRVTRRAAEAAMGTGEAKDALRELGINAADFLKLSLAEKMYALSNAFGQVGSQADRVRLAFKLFDAEGVAMVQLLENNTAQLKQMTAEFRRLNGVLSDESAAAFEKYNDSVARMKASWEGFLVTTGPGVATWLSEQIESWNTLVTTYGSATSALKELGRAIVGVVEDRNRLGDTADRLLFGGDLSVEGYGKFGTRRYRLGGATDILRAPLSAGSQMLGGPEFDPFRGFIERGGFGGAIRRMIRGGSLPPGDQGDPRGGGAMSRVQAANEAARARNEELRRRMLPRSGPMDRPFSSSESGPMPGRFLGPGSVFGRSSAMDKPLPIAQATNLVQSVVSSTMQIVGTAIGGFTTGTKDAIQQNILTQTRQQTVLLRDMLTELRSGGTSFV